MSLFSFDCSVGSIVLMYYLQRLSRFQATQDRHLSLFYSQGNDQHFYPVHAKTLEPTVLFKLPNERFLELINRNHYFALKLIEVGISIFRSDADVKNDTAVVFFIYSTRPCKMSVIPWSGVRVGEQNLPRNVALSNSGQDYSTRIKDISYQTT